MDAAVQRAKEPQPSTTGAIAEAPKDLVEKFGWLPCQLSLDIPVVNFTVADLLCLSNHSIVETACPSTGDVPLRANGLLFARAEFEVIGNRLAVRLTELA